MNRDREIWKLGCSFMREIKRQLEPMLQFNGDGPLQRHMDRSLFSGKADK